MTRAGLEGVELLQLEVLELESGPCCMKENWSDIMEQTINVFYFMHCISFHLKL
jgi:hypothetical protein